MSSTVKVWMNSEQPASEVSDFVLSPAERIENSRAIIHRNESSALRPRLVPVPVFDLVAITGIQLKMLREMSQVYNLEFSEGLVKKAIASLLTGLGGVGLRNRFAPSLANVVSLVAAACTRATGAVYLLHFETGGNVFNFDPMAMRDDFNEAFLQAVEDLNPTVY